MKHHLGRHEDGQCAGRAPWSIDRCTTPADDSDGDQGAPHEWRDREDLESAATDRSDVRRDRRGKSRTDEGRPAKCMGLCGVHRDVQPTVRAA